MEQNGNSFAPEAPADESASPRKPQACAPAFDPPPLLSDALGETLAETFPEGARKPRHDGWTPEAVAAFLEHLAATGVVEHAARAVGLSAQSAYAFRNRRQGRAFAMMWDAVLVHRARARVASELQARSIAGCVSIRKRDGEVVGEYHYYDNRLAMAMLTRLDRLAEREAASDAHLRALSEDLDGFVDCLAAGGDADAFVEALRPPEPEPEPAPPPPRPRDDDPELTRFAVLAGCPSYRDVDPREIAVLDLDPTRTAEWEPDQWVRAFRSGFLTSVEIRKGAESGWQPGPGAPIRFHFALLSAAAAHAQDPDRLGDPPEPEAVFAALKAVPAWDWTEEQLASAWRSGLFVQIADEYWDRLAAERDDWEAEK